MSVVDHRAIRPADADAIVIGAGLNGLVCAALLAQARLRVLILEAQDRPGGFCATGAFIPGFRAPTYTSWIGPFDPGLIKALKLQKFGLDPSPQRLSTLALSADGHNIVLDSHARRGVGALAQHSQTDAKTYPAFESAMRKVAAGLGAHMSEPPLRAAAKAQAVVRVRQDDISRTGLNGLAFRSIASVVEEYFEAPLLQGALALEAVIGTGLGPQSPGSALAWIEKLAMETVRSDTSVWFQGGPGALIQALLQAAQSGGATLRANAAVRGLIAHHGQVEGVILSGGEAIYAPVVVSSQSPGELLNWSSVRRASAPGSHRLVSQDKPPHSLAKVHLALRGSPQFKGLDKRDLQARLLIATSLDNVIGAYEAAIRGDVWENPPMEAILPTAIDPSLAAKDGHVLSVTLPFAPSAPNEGWPAAKERLTLSAIAVLSRYAPDLPNRVLAAEAETPDMLARIGANPLWRRVGPGPMHAENPFAGLLEGLFFCGAGTHPRMGASGLNGRNCAEAILALRPLGSDAP